MKDPYGILFIKNDKEKVAVLAFENTTLHISVRMKDDLTKELFTIEITSSETWIH